MPPLFADFHSSRLLLSVGVLIRNVMQCLRDGRWRRRSLLRFLLLSLSLAAQNRFPFPRDRENHPLLLVEFAAFCIVQSHDNEDEACRACFGFARSRGTISTMEFRAYPGVVVDIPCAKSVLQNFLSGGFSLPALPSQKCFPSSWAIAFSCILRIYNAGWRCASFEWLVTCTSRHDTGVASPRKILLRSDK
jgi:hypothetical protein